MYIVIDTETTGLHYDYNKNDCPSLVQLSWNLYNSFFYLIHSKNYIVNPNNKFEIPFKSIKIHGITNEIAIKKGKNIKYILNKFEEDLNKSNVIIGHNISFDIKIIEFEFIKNKKKKINFFLKKIIDTKIESCNFCKIYGKGKRFKWPKLSELYEKLFNKKIKLLLHNSFYDVQITSLCFFKMIKIGILFYKEEIKKKYYKIINKNIENIFSFIKNENEKKIKEIKENEKKIIKKKLKIKKNIYNIYNNYSHIHNHSHFSILYSTITIKSLINRAIEFNMPAVGITDYGNMMGSFYFLDYIHKLKKNKNIKIKGVVGCEFFISHNYLIKKFTKNYPDIRYNQVLIAKNKIGYYNLSKLCSHGFIDGYYSGIPRIGKELIKKYKNNLIALSGDLNSEIPYTILNKGKKKAEKIFLWWYNLFKEDFYIEILRHNLEEEDYVNKILLKFSKKYNVKYIIQNNNFYLNKNDSYTHDILLCIKNREKKNTPIGNGFGKRFGFPNNEFYFKNQKEMSNIFFDLSKGFYFLNELLNKIEIYDINKKIEIPKFTFPKNFKKYSSNYLENSNKYLKYLVYKGANKKYYNYYDYSIIKKRIQFELKIIKKIKYSVYFLIVQDIIKQAKKMNIFVGPGRGSVAGSIVSYCLDITQIDPIKYNLLFERFLNTDRINLPDIDIDFDDKGREKIIKWVYKKYGKEKVAKIITYGTMAAKSSIRDVGRVMDFSLYEVNKLTKIIPLNSSLKEIFEKDWLSLKKKFSHKELKNIFFLRKEIEKKSFKGYILMQSKKIEGLIRNIGIHACGIIISNLNIKKFIPVFLSKDSDLLITQFDNKVVEKVGLLKMDFLGLKTLSIIKDTLKKINKKIFFSLNDKKTYETFKQGNTIGIFQYESTGMRKYLKKLKPDNINDLIAMNALYRPGPLKYITEYINRKNGKKKIQYDIPIMKKILKETYGITIYQEQVMLLSQIISNFSKGEADLLRKAMGKKNKNILINLKKNFLIRGIKNNYSKKILEKIWKDWEYFASYAFNKSHATCYTIISFKAAYLKTHYSSEYISSFLSNIKDVKEITILIKECKRLKIKILPPNINKSYYNFTVEEEKNKKNIRFGMKGIKGIGNIAIENIINEREKNGKYTSIYNFIKRINLRIVNKKVIENLIFSGSLDEFKIDRLQYFCIKKNISILEMLIKLGTKYKSNKKNNQNSLFDYEENINDIINIKEYNIFPFKEKKILYYKEKEIIGFSFL